MDKVTEKPEINVREYLAGPQGMNFVLQPIQDLHSKEDVEEVKRQLYRDRDVVTMKTTWLVDPKAVAKWKEASCQKQT